MSLDASPLPDVVELAVPRGSDDRSEAVWALKEGISRREGVLVQRRPFFDALYRGSRVYLALDRRRDGAVADGVVGFALARPDGYLSLLGVRPGHRRRGLGTRLLDRVAAEHDEVTCHVRTSNDRAVGFYTARGFVVDRLVPGYYRDGTDAYHMVRDPDRAAGLEDVL